MTIIIELLIIILVVAMGAVFWSVFKAPQHLRKMLIDENGLKTLLIGESGELLLNKFESDKPRPADYFIEKINNILNSCRTEYQKLRNTCFFVAVLLIGGSFFLGKTYFALNILAFGLLSRISVVEPVQQKLSADIVTIATGIAKWHSINAAECSAYCRARPELNYLHKIVAAI